MTLDSRSSLQTLKPDAILVMNLGTPDAPEPKAVGRYLRQFLMDKWVVDIPKILRWILVHILIVPKRRHDSAHAYSEVWTERGSPLMFHSKDLTAAIAKEFPNHPVELGMRYGNPSTKSALQALKNKGAKRVFVFSQYPQYAESSTRTAHEECERAAQELGLELKFVDPFYAHPSFVAAYADQIRPVLEREKPDHLLFSYHGVPERHVKRTDATGSHCLTKPGCCDQITLANKFCYRAHCFATTRALAKILDLKKGSYSVSFQSRLGRTPWIQPFTDVVIKDLPKKGVKSLAVVTPSFTADCLETIEEIGIRAKEDFLEAGGQRFTRIECLNAHSSWVPRAAEIIREQL